MQKIWGPKSGSSRPKSGPKLGFLPFSQVWFISFPLSYIGWLEQFLTTSKAKICNKKKKKKKELKFGSNRPKSGPKLGFLPFS